MKPGFLYAPCSRQDLYCLKTLSVGNFNHRPGYNHRSRETPDGKALRRVSIPATFSVVVLTCRMGRAETFILVTILYVLGYVRFFPFCRTNR